MPQFRLSSFVIASSVIALGALVGCGSSSEEDQSIAGPPPSEPTVFEASAETKKELGIEKWGFDTDETGDHMTYRGYGAKNEVIAVVKQDVDSSNPMHLYFTLKIDGAVGSAVEKIEWYAQPTAEDPTKSDIYTLVTENSFEENSKQARVLAQFQADGAARQGGTSGGTLVGKAHPMDEQQLVDRCKDLNERCQIALIDQRIAAAGRSGECGLLKLVGVPVLTAASGAGIGAGLGLLGGPLAPATSTGGAIGGAIIGAGSGAIGQGASCISAYFDARAAQRELDQCRAQQRAQNCR